MPPPRPDIAWLVLVQRPHEAPPLPTRPDLTILPLPGAEGTSASRNAALEAARTPFVLFADDDVTPDMDGIARLLARITALPGGDGKAPDILTGRLTGSGKRYPETARRLHLYNCGKTGTPEIMLRLDRVRARGLRFDTAFGLGSAQPLGEEFVFLADALKAGLSARFEPVTLGHHPGPSSGSDWTDPANLRARIAVLSRVFGRAAPVLRTAFAWKHRRALRAAPGGAWGFVRGRVSEPRAPARRGETL